MSGKGGFVHPKSDELCREASSSEPAAPPALPDRALQPLSTVPPEIVGLMESFLSPSDCARLSATCVAFHRRWTARRWRRTFNLHYGRRPAVEDGAATLGLASGVMDSPSSSLDWSEAGNDNDGQHQDRRGGPLHVFKSPHESASSSSSHSSCSYVKPYGTRYFPSWEESFVGCCCDDDYSCSSLSGALGGGPNRGCPCSPCPNASTAAESTQFNVSALIPSITRAYSNLWDTIELALLGYYDAAHFGIPGPPINVPAVPQPGHTDEVEQRGVPAVIQALRNAVLPDLKEYCFFVVGFKPLTHLANSLVPSGLRFGTFFKKETDQVPRTKRGSSLRRGLYRSTEGGSGVHPMATLRSSATSMSAWKLACILKEQGVDCLRCSICDQIDLSGDPQPGTATGFPSNHRTPEWFTEFRLRNSGGQVWMSPCRCPELVHRRCLERKLGLVPKLAIWEWTRYCLLRLFRSKEDIIEANQGGVAPRVWTAYDDGASAGPQVRPRSGPAAADARGRLVNPSARCTTCHFRYRRAVRLPRTKSEVFFSSLSDPLSLLRAFSTFVHFLLAFIFLAASEGMCDSPYCDSHWKLMESPFVLKWPSTGARGLALAWWQLQQCCMLHIFFSPRFAAIVDRLWMGPISFFYCRLYFYFVITSGVLASSYIPMVSRAIHGKILLIFLSDRFLQLLGPVWAFIGYVNLAQYAVVSTTVICIFWRTNYRIYTIADGREAAVARQSRRHHGDNPNDQNDDLDDDGGAGHHNGLGVPLGAAQALGANGPGGAGVAGGLGGVLGVWNSHPIYHGEWQ